MRALIYGHSQSGGMGLDVEKLLKQKGFTVVRETKVGYTDRRLVSYLPNVPSGPYDRVYLYVGGNSDVPDVKNIRALIEHFGASRTVVVLGPVNLDHAERAPTLQARNAGNRAGVADLVRVYDLQAGQSAFWPDKLHVKPGVPESKRLAEQIVAETLTGGSLSPAPSGDNGAVWAAASVLGFALWWRFFRRA